MRFKIVLEKQSINHWIQQTMHTTSVQVTWSSTQNLQISS